MLSWSFSRQNIFWYFRKGKSFLAKKILAGKNELSKKEFSEIPGYSQQGSVKNTYTLHTPLSKILAITSNQEANENNKFKELQNHVILFWMLRMRISKRNYSHYSLFYCKLSGYVQKKFKQSCKFNPWD